MNQSDDPTNWIAIAILLIIALGLLTSKEGDLVMRAVAVGSTSLIGTALFVVAAWERWKRK